jgi:thiol-disulfide isomerase/thioredoxin
MPPLPPDLPPPVLEVFYSPTCTPCRLELPVLAELQRRGEATLRIVILDQEERARSELRAVSERLDGIASGPAAAAPGDTLRAAGDANGILPYARSVAAGGEVCAKWSGGLTIERAKSLLAACARLVTSPRRSPS